MEIVAGTDPFDLFQTWFDEAVKSEINDPDAVALASVDANGMPSVRVVLLKEWSPAGFVIYTNYESRKASELLATGKAAFSMHWKSLRRQVRVVGSVSKAEPAQSDAYFASRGRGSQIGAWASEQSRPLESRFALEKRVAEYAARHVVGKVPRPPYWSGFRLQPVRIEFWQDGAFRLHDRLEYRLHEGLWSIQRLQP